MVRGCVLSARSPILRVLQTNVLFVMRLVKIYYLILEHCRVFFIPHSCLQPVFRSQSKVLHPCHRNTTGVRHYIYTLQRDPVTGRTRAEHLITLTMLDQNPTCVPTVVDHLLSVKCACVSICSRKQLWRLGLTPTVRHFHLLLREGETGRRQVWAV